MKTWNRSRELGINSLGNLTNLTEKTTNAEQARVVHQLLSRISQFH